MLRLAPGCRVMLGYRSGQTPPTQDALARPKADDEKTDGTKMATAARLLTSCRAYLDQSETRPLKARNLVRHGVADERDMVCHLTGVSVGIHSSRQAI